MVNISPDISHMYACCMSARTSSTIIHKGTSVFAHTHCSRVLFEWIHLLSALRENWLFFFLLGTSVILWVFTDIHFWEEQRFFLWAKNYECFFLLGSMLIGIYFSLHLLKDDFKTSFLMCALWMDGRLCVKH